LRSKAAKPAREKNHHTKVYWAEISFDKNTFSISDNCGGIPWSLHPYAFTMGRDSDPVRPADATGTVGVYGIGMKRAIFKMGRQAQYPLATTVNAYDVEIDPNWIDRKVDWKLPSCAIGHSTRAARHNYRRGSLHPPISDRFSVDRQEFQNTLQQMIETHYAVIIRKGLRIKINGTWLSPDPCNCSSHL